MSTRVSAGTVRPHFAATNVADFPTRAGLGSRCGVTSTLATASISAADMKYPPCAWNSRLTSSAIASSTTTEFSDEQSTPLSNVLPVMMSRTALGTSAVRSMYAGALPGPTP